MSFADNDLARLREAEEIDIETQAPEGQVKRTTIWIVVAEGEAFVRSVNGERGEWYRAALANPAVAVRVDGRSLAATAIRATDPASIERVSDAFESKYARYGASLASMLQPHTLPTTLRLEPV
jgi:hypothetical protein